MNGLKKQFIKSFLKLKVIEINHGLLKIQIASLSDLDKKFRVYDRYVERALMLLNGVEDVEIDYEKSTITVHYNEQITTPQKIYNWVQEVIDVIIDNLEFIEKYGENQVEATYKRLEEVLKRRMTAFKS